MSTPENEAAATPDRGSDQPAPATPTPIGEDVEHHHDITDDDLPEDLQPSQDNPLAAGPVEGEDASAFDPPGRTDGGEPADESSGESDDSEPADGS